MTKKHHISSSLPGDDVLHAVNYSGNLFLQRFENYGLGGFSSLVSGAFTNSGSLWRSLATVL